MRTVLGDVPPESIGITYAHEHVIIDGPLIIERWPHIHLPSVDDAISELRLCAEAGVQTVVDAMPAGAGGDIARLAEISRRTGVNVIATTGMHTAKYYEGKSWALRGPPEALAARFVSDVTEGMGGTDSRAGIIKVATTGGKPTDFERRLFEAAAMTSQSTGVAVLTHCEQGEGAFQQIAMLQGLEVPLGRVILSHTDKVNDPVYHREILASGVNVEYDQSLRQATQKLPASARLIVQMCEEGFGDQIMLGTDGARRSLWTTLGGSPGLAWLAMGFRGILRDLGLAESQLKEMLVDNPARVLPLAPY